jgi:hypothetical protein
VNGIPDGAQDDAEAPDEPPVDTAGVRRGAVRSGGIGAVLLAGALVVYLAGGAPYGQNVAGTVLYLAGLLAALIASVLLWMAWSTPEGRISPRHSAGMATAAGALLLTGASVVVSLGRAGGAEVQLTLIGGTAVVLAAAVATVLPGARRDR